MSDTPAPSPFVSPTPTRPIVVRGRILTVTHDFVIFTTGAAVRIGTATVPAGLALGRTVRVTLDPATHAATAIALAAGAAPAVELDVAQLPNDYLAGSSAQSAARAELQAELVPVTIGVLVPPSTPVSDDVYLTTERSSFSPAETKMNRVDAQHFTIKLALPKGMVLHYRFTRGSNTTAERTLAGTIPDPHALTAVAGLQAHNEVARWADQN